MALYHHPFTSGTHQYHTFPGFAQSTPPEPITNPPLPPQKYASSAVVVYTVLMRRSIRKFNIPPPRQPPGHLNF